MTSMSSGLLMESDAALLLSTNGIPYVRHAVALDAEEAAVRAGEIGYPVVLKVLSADIVHKTEVGGVVTGVRNEQELRSEFAVLLARVAVAAPDSQVAGVLVCEQVAVSRELIVGAFRDETFGPAVMIGLGGVFAELLQDVVFRLAPVSDFDAHDMVHELRGGTLLSSVRGEHAADVDELAGILKRVGRLIVTHQSIREMDLNPVAVTVDGCLALDARVVLG